MTEPKQVMEVSYTIDDYEALRKEQQQQPPQPQPQSARKPRTPKPVESTRARRQSVRTPKQVKRLCEE